MNVSIWEHGKTEGEHMYNGYKTEYKLILAMPDPFLPDVVTVGVILVTNGGAISSFSRPTPVPPEMYGRRFSNMIELSRKDLENISSFELPRTFGPHWRLSETNYTNFEKEELKQNIFKYSL